MDQNTILRETPDDSDLLKLTQSLINRLHDMYTVIAAIGDNYTGESHNIIDTKRLTVETVPSFLQTMNSITMYMKESLNVTS